MESTKSPNWTNWLFVGIACILLIILVWQLRLKNIALKSLKKRYATSLQIIEDQLKKDLKEGLGMDKKLDATEMTQDVLEEQVDIPEAELVVPTSSNPVIPASLKYKIQPLEGKFSFNAIPTNANYQHTVFCNLEKLGAAEEQLVFRLLNADGTLKHSESRLWPIEGKEIGTILNGLFTPQ